MNIKFKRTLAFLLSIVMVFGMIPGSALKGYAADYDYTIKFYGDYSEFTNGIYYANEYSISRFTGSSTNHTDVNKIYPTNYENSNYIVFDGIYMPNVNTITYNISNIRVVDGGDVGTFSTKEELYNLIKDKDEYACDITCFKNGDNYFYVLPTTFLNPSVLSKNSSDMHCKVFIDNPQASEDDTVYLACIPDDGYKFENFYYYDNEGTKQDLDGNSFTVPSQINESCVYVGANTTKYEIKFDPHMEKRIERAAELVNLTGSEVEEFKKFIGSLSNYDEYVNSTKFILDLFKPIYKELYKFDYENNISGMNSLEKYVNDLTNQAPSLTLAMSVNDTAKYEKKIMGILLLSYIGYLDEIDDDTITDLSDESFFDVFKTVMNGCNSGGTSVITAFNNSLKTIMGNMKDRSGSIASIASSKESKSSSLKDLIFNLDDDNFWIELNEPYEANEYERYLSDIKELMEDLINDNVENTDIESILKYKELQDIAENEVREWALEGTNYTDTLEKYIAIYEDGDESIEEIKTMISTYEANKAGMSDDEKSESKFEITKKVIKVLVRRFLDTQALIETEFLENSVGEFSGILEQNDGFPEIASIGNIFNKINIIKTESSYYKPYDTLYDNNLFSVIETVDLPVGTLVTNIIDRYPDTDEMIAYYNNLREQIKLGVPPVVTSSGSKKYKANDTKDTAEKISGSGKKGSTRTITPIEGKKVASVIVTDKDGNKIDVTLNEDGTYSFVQPASNVDVQVNYKNREITLNIGSTTASVDGETSNLDVAPILRNDRTMLPIRFVAENLGAKVGWDEKNPNIVTISRGDVEITIHLGSDKAYVNGKEYLLDSVAFAENDRTYMPVRFISEALNAIVEWNEAKPNEVKIYEQ